MIGIVAASSPLQMIWDLGANTGDYSRLAAATGAHVVSFDGDRTVVEQHFEQSRAGGPSILPLIQDLANPSPGAGWSNSERRSLLERGPADLALALALVHHLSIGCNVPLESVAAFFERICRHVIIEFVPKEDSQVQRMLALRDDVFTGYNRVLLNGRSVIASDSCGRPRSKER